MRAFVPFVLLPSLAFAQAGLLTYSVKPAVTEGSGYPQVFVEALSDFDKVTLECSRDDGESLSASFGRTKRGTKRTFDLKQPSGIFTWTCEARGIYGSAEDEFFDLPFRVRTFLGAGLSIDVPRDAILIPARMLTAKSDRVIEAAHLTVITPDGPVFDQDVEVFDNNPGDELLLEWSGDGQDVLRIDVTLTDEWGFWAVEEIYPWSLEIPHEDILFATGSHEISVAEQPKVDKAYKDMMQVVERYSRFVEVRLYIAGYTDSVGDRASNQALSQRRAKAISEAFAKGGFPGGVYYQGMGEDGQAMPTDDEVEMEANRRAVYLLASRPPPISKVLPRGNWKKL